MKIKYIGIRGFQERFKGCHVCGRKSTVRESRPLQYSFKVVLPSETIKVFIINKVYEVSESDGNFLLDFTYKSAKGDTQYPFIKES